MENATKAIIIAAAVVVTLALVTVGFLVLRSGQDTAKTSIQKLNKINSEVNDSDYTIYDGINVSGNEVVNAITKFQKDYTGIEVITGKVPAGIWYIHNVTISSNVGTVGGAAAGTIALATDTTSSNYINPTGSFKGSVVRDANGAVSALIFIQQ